MVRRRVLETSQVCGLPPLPSSPFPSPVAGKAASSGQIPATVPPLLDAPRAPDGEKGCESCLAITTATRWYPWGPAHEHCRLCNLCYTYWRKYGGLKLPTRWGQFSRDLRVLVVWCGVCCVEASEKKAGVMTATALLQRRLNKGLHCLLHWRPCSAVCCPLDRPSGPPKLTKKAPRHVAARKSGDIIPPVPFCMRPTPHTLFSRQGIGGRSLMKAARHPTTAIIVPNSSPKPSGGCALAAVGVATSRLLLLLSGGSAEVHCCQADCPAQTLLLLPQSGLHPQQTECPHFSSEAADCPTFSHSHLPRLQGSQS